MISVRRCSNCYVFRLCGNRFTLKTTLMLMRQLLYRVETLHLEGGIHRDIKPENFVLGTGVRGNIVYMIVFGLAGRRMEYSEAESPSPEGRAGVQVASSSQEAARPRFRLIGICRYASINAHVDVK
ncbi:uncharacterized protein PV06_08235 [Exophiala oligosperma]|uniref:Protein kinase domain-containing protein n=1 Tax=Exophiala oligosperma TaxID=215243 RepID=A0A0D2D947_9EURO|nr:uncharacterized protein PV06_08235 [Exophiala oligosperma]KIW39638.1 hypothetical protein PV06_08235 [Exophiala oligosperma]